MYLNQQVILPFRTKLSRKNKWTTSSQTKINQPTTHTYLSPCRNPRQGEIINHPNGDDVYHGVPKDYIQEVRINLLWAYLFSKLDIEKVPKGLLNPKRTKL